MDTEGLHPDLPSAPRASESLAELPRRERSQPLRFVVHASLLADLGTLPSWTQGGAIGAGLALGSLRIQVGVVAWTPQWNAPFAFDGGGATVGLVAARAIGCYLVAFDPLEIGGCASVEAGAMFAVGQSLENGRTSSGAWVAAGVVGAAGWRFSTHWVLDLEVGPNIPIAFPEFYVTGVAVPIYRTSAVAFRAGIDLSYAF